MKVTIKTKSKKALTEAQNIKIKSKKTTKKSGKSDTELDENQETLNNYRNQPIKDSMQIDETKIDKEMCKLIDENNFNFCGKQILKQTIEHPETAYKQIKKLEKCKEEIEKSGKNTVNYTDPEARKSPNKEGKTQTGYNE